MPQRFSSEILWIIIAIGGGVAKTMGVFLKETDPGTLRLRAAKLVANVCISAFSGLMFGYLSQIITDNESLTFLFVGAGGYFGSEAMDWLARFLKEKFLNQKGETE